MSGVLSVFPHCASLQNYSISGNGLVDMYPVKFAPNLSSFEAAGNSIKTLNPDQFDCNKFLKIIDLSSNLFEQIPFAIQLTPTIQILNLDNNQIQTFDVKNMPELREFSINANKVYHITELPSKLTRFEVGNNRIMTIPNNVIPSTIQDLKINVNSLLDIGDSSIYIQGWAICSDRL